jgi:hypothetical protein
VVGDPSDHIALQRQAAGDRERGPQNRFAVKARWVKYRWNPVVTPSAETT